jgi:hypothetical protein
MNLIPIYDATAPISCTIRPEELADRIDLVERLRASLDRAERTEYGMLLSFTDSPTVAEDVQRFVVDEKRCCQFWGFEVQSKRTELVLRWDGPPGTEELLDRLRAFFMGEGALADIEGLL